MSDSSAIQPVMSDVPNQFEDLARAPTHEEIARRAYQLFEERGHEPGHEWDDWFQAERELRESGILTQEGAKLRRTSHG